MKKRVLVTMTKRQTFTAEREVDVPDDVLEGVEADDVPDEIESWLYKEVEEGDMPFDEPSVSEADNEGEWMLDDLELREEE